MHASGKGECGFSDMFYSYSGSSDLTRLLYSHTFTSYCWLLKLQSYLVQLDFDFFLSEQVGLLGV